MPQAGKILIVDDQEMNLILLEELLADAYQLEMAMSGEEAITVAAAFQPDLILLDIMMPGIDGYETCRQLRQLPELSHTKIVMVSARDQLDDRLQGYTVGADDYLIKPYDEEELLAKIHVYQRLKSVEELDRLKTGMLALLSHETRTPLSGMLGTLDLLMDHDDLDPDERQEYFEMMRQSMHRLKYYLEQVSLLSQMQAGQWHLELAPSHLSDVIEMVIDGFAEKLQEKEIRLIRNLHQDAEVMLDVPQMERVISALLDNAIRFSEKQATVSVNLACDEAYSYVSITDEGQGISSEYLPYLFQGFIDAHIHHHSEGHGLSLAISRHIVQAHQGTITVQSQVGCGSTFTIKLPRSHP